MKKILLLVSIFVFCLSISVVCFASEKPSETSVSPSENTFSLSTIVNYNGRNGEQLSTNITVNNMSNRYVPVVYFRYCPDNENYYGLSVFVSIYDKQDKKAYVPQRSLSDSSFIDDNFYKTGQLVVNTDGQQVGVNGTTFFIYRSDYLDGLKYQSNNSALPYIIVNTSNFSTYPLFTPDEVNDKGQWFIEGNNYPYNKNNVWSDTIYYPSASAMWSDNHNPSPEHEDFNIYSIDFQLEDNGSVKYKDLSKYYVELWTSTENKPDLVYQRDYKISDIKFIQGVNYNGYQIKDFYNKILPYTVDFQNITTNVYIRLRYVDNDVNLVSTFAYWVQEPHLVNPIGGTSYISKDNLPISQKPSEVVPGSFKPGSLNGTYDFGDFNAFDFVKGGGGLKSLTSGVSTVFSFLPPWLWQMMWYVLGALAVIALLKVVIS